MGSERDKEFMARAIELSRKAGIVDRTGNCFGCVIVKDGEIVGEGYNQVFSQNDPTWHAEMHAIRDACARQGKPSLPGCIMYTSTVPCPMCTGAVYWSMIEKVFYAATNEDVSRGGGFETAFNVFEGDEHKKSPADRTRVPFVQLMQEQAAEVFAEFKALPEDEKNHY